MVIAAEWNHNDAIFPVDLAYEIAAHVNDPQIQARLASASI